MFGVRRLARRFNLLLLEEGEFYVRDFLASCAWPSDVSGNWQRAPRLMGQLRLCTKSLFFEPDDTRVPIVRLPFASIQSLEGRGDRRFEVVATQLLKMKAAAADAPYVSERGRLEAWAFELSYARLDDFMPPAQQMLLASRMPRLEQEEFLQSFLAQLEAGLAFDPGHLRSPASESIVLEVGVLSLTPLVRDPGLLVVTDSRLYLQPLHNVSGDAPVYSHPLPAVVAVARRRSSLRDVGLEVFFMQPEPGSQAAGPYWGSPSAFFAFRSREDREAAAAALAAQPQLGAAVQGGRAVAAASGSLLEADGAWLPRVTAAWQRGVLTNFDYLMYLNLAAGRSSLDLTQYPVFPWVLADYSSPALDLSDPATFRDLSRPVGALSPDRLAMLRRRYAEMPTDDPASPPFLYGTHYSCPGYTMFWLVRAAPAHMLRLQNGRFDAPDRLFCSVAESWASVLSNPADVKELIPEFFLPRPDFLVNKQHLALGTRQNGRPVGDVELPPWASGPAHFLAVHRAALEAPFVSANLHHWINLIFGHKQRGAAAVEADNVFRHITYEGAVDTSTIADPAMRQALEMEINEFGQSPRQLFTRPHPPRLQSPPMPAPEAAFGAGAEGDVGGQALSVGLMAAIRAATEEDGARGPLEVPAVLAELDVVRRREEGRVAAQPAEAPPAAAPAEPPAASSADAGRELPRESLTASPGGDPSRYERLKSWASDTRLGDAFGALRGAIGDAATSPRERASASLKGLFSRRPAASPKQEQHAAAAPAEEPEAERGAEPAAAEPGEESSSAGVGPSASGRGEAAPGPAPQPSAAGMASTIGGGMVWKVAGRRGIAAPSALGDDDSGDESMEEGGGSGIPSRQSGGCSVAGEEDAAPLASSSPRPWGPGLRDRLRPLHQIHAGCEALNAVALASVAGAPLAYTAGAGGTLWVHSLEDGQQIRAAALGAQPLTSLALVGAPPGGAHPTVLCGSYDSQVHAYSVESGRVAGAWVAHSDAVSCLELVPSCKGGPPRQLATASWDGTVKLWALAEGRHPWAVVGSPQPLAAVPAAAGVWALAVGQDGNLLLTGTEDGVVSAWDLRCAPASGRLWERALSQDYVGGLCLTPDGDYALAATADGTLSLLDLRRGGASLSAASCGAPLHGCQTDGALAVAGDEEGRVHFWDVAQQRGRLPAGGGRWTPPRADGLYEPLRCAGVGVNAQALEWLPAGGGRLYLATAHEEGLLHISCCEAP